MIVPERRVRVASVTGLGAVFLAAIAAQALAIAQSWGAWYWMPGSASAAAVCLLALPALPGRGRSLWPAVAGLGVAALAIAATHLAGPELPAEPSPAMALGLAVLIAMTLRAQPPIPAGAVAGAGLAVVATDQFAAGPSSGIAAVTALSGMIWLAAIGAGLSLRLLDVRARDTAEQVRQAERLELARELHDVVAHHITGMVVQAQGAQVVARRDPERVAEYLSEMETAGTDALAAMRRVVGLLRDEADAAPASPGPERLGALVERFRRQGPAVRLEMRVWDRGGAGAGTGTGDGAGAGTGGETGGRGGDRGGPETRGGPEAGDGLETGDGPEAGTGLGGGEWPPEVTSTVYRVVQESLTNVLRHAPKARSVVVTVEESAQDVIVEVADDAPAAPARSHHRGGYGLIGMRERVETLGGSLRAGPRPGGGWSVRAVLPVPAGEHR
ncbi:sensor histidine kinase [Spirillospora sp. NPDC048911]|uniref:sensor histidine kinase n=1 Tax=Spirillospora sp. NPDC048911 TaxID=3364527 RepID=UPI0037211262